MAKKCDYKQNGIKYPIPFDFVRILREIGANNGTGKRAGNFIKKKVMRDCRLLQTVDYLTKPKKNM